MSVAAVAVRLRFGPGKGANVFRVGGTVTVAVDIAAGADSAE